MRPAQFQTLTVPAPTANGNPATLATAADKPLRVLVRNLTGSTIFLGSELGDLIGNDGAPTVKTFRLPANAEDIFVIAPKQALLAVSTGGVGLVSVATSEALQEAR